MNVCIVKTIIFVPFSSIDVPRHFDLRYASDAPVIRYAKIAMKLPEKTVRDVALRCRWMNVSEINLASVV